MNMNKYARTNSHSIRRHLLALLATVMLIATACSSDGAVVDSSSSDDSPAVSDTDDAVVTEDADTQEGDTQEGDTEETDAGGADIDVAAGCDEIAALFGTNGSANADMPDPESSAVCEGDMVVISANGIPDYTYIETSPGPPRAQELNYSIPAAPTMADETTSVPLIGALGVTLAGIPIFGPTEGTGGDVGSIPGIIMDCGGHNGPTGFHLHLIGFSPTSDCDFTPEEIESGPQLVGYAFDGFPIYTGNAQYLPSYELTDESLFASDTWGAHTYVEGLGDLDECNGLTDGDGNYAYYTTDAFPYMIGCFVGAVELGGGGGGGGRGDGPPPEGEEGDRRGPPPGEGEGEGGPPPEGEEPPPEGDDEG